MLDPPADDEYELLSERARQNGDSFVAARPPSLSALAHHRENPLDSCHRCVSATLPLQFWSEEEGQEKEEEQEEV